MVSARDWWIGRSSAQRTRRFRFVANQRGVQGESPGMFPHNQKVVRVYRERCTLDNTLISSETSPRSLSTETVGCARETSAQRMATRHIAALERESSLSGGINP